MGKMASQCQKKCASTRERALASAPKRAVYPIQPTRGVSLTLLSSMPRDEEVVEGLVSAYRRHQRFGAGAILWSDEAAGFQRGVVVR
jgi:hypothetical protein